MMVLPQTGMFQPRDCTCLSHQIMWVFTVSVLHQNLGGIGKSIPDARKISLVLVEHGYNPSLLARMHAKSVPTEWNREEVT